MTRFSPIGFYTAYEILEFIFRIVLAGVLGMIVGYAREKRHKVVGVRTHFIIAVTTALLMILSKYAFVDVAALMDAGSRGNDNSRMAAQVISGVSFLCAGVIFKQGFSVRGLTTAAGMWATAAIGLAIGSGMYWIGLVSFAFILVVQSLTHLQSHGNLTTSEVSVSVAASSNAQEKIVEVLKRNNFEVSCVKVAKKGETTLFGYVVRGNRTLEDLSLNTTAIDDDNINEISIKNDV